MRSVWAVGIPCDEGGADEENTKKGEADKYTQVSMCAEWWLFRCHVSDELRRRVAHMLFLVSSPRREARLGNRAAGDRGTCNGSSASVSGRGGVRGVSGPRRTMPRRKSKKKRCRLQGAMSLGLSVLSLSPQHLS